MLNITTGKVRPRSRTRELFRLFGTGATTTTSDPAQFDTRHTPLKTAIVYCEANFGGIDGKTANGLVRHSQVHDVVSVIDSEQVGLDAGMVLDGRANGIPIHANLTDAIAGASRMPDCFIFGKAPASGRLSAAERLIVLEAIALRMNIVCGLHEFLTDDAELVDASNAAGVTLTDVRKPRAKHEMRTYSGEIEKVTCPRIAVLGTDCAIGKRTTATVLARALNELGLKTVMIGTGQTGLMQGARYGVALDAIPSQFCAGELEATIVEAFENESPDVIVVEGQGALSHPAYSTSSFILRGSRPHAVILQHAPGREHRCDFDQMPMPDPRGEIELIEMFGNTRVIGLTINHEQMSDDQVDEAIGAFERELGIPVTDALSRSPERLVEMVIDAFPELSRQQHLNLLL